MTKKPALEGVTSRAGKPKTASSPGKEGSQNTRYSTGDQGAQSSDDDATTLGWSIFQDGIYGARTLPDIKNQLEMKYATCLSTGSANGFPIPIDQIDNPIFRQITTFALVLKNWTTADLASCHGRLAIPAAGILNATLESPEWGEDDYHVFRLLESLKAYQRKAQQGGKSL